MLAILNSTPSIRVVGGQMTPHAHRNHFTRNEVVEKEEIRDVAGGGEFTPQVRENPLKQMLSWERRKTL